MRGSSVRRNKEATVIGSHRADAPAGGMQRCSLRPQRPKPACIQPKKG